jgi:PAT family acetyl-CoA transporter-like MFS transporter 1
MGLSGSIPIIMKENGASYSSLSMFSLVSLPFSLKLLWAPIVDSQYLKSVGRRKTWLVIVQILCGLVMISGSYNIEDWLSGSSSSITTGEPDGFSLTCFFFMLYFLMATQDIAVDGWALTMLSKQNIGYASTCNVLGQIIGIFLSNQGFIALSDSQWCLKYLGTSEALIDLPIFMRFWGFVFLVVTVIVCVFKKEDPIDPEDEPDGLYDTYMHVIAIFKLVPVQLLSMILLTVRFAFAPSDGVSMFKLQEYGMPKSDIATISPILLFLSILMPALTGKYFSRQPLSMFLGGVILKVITSMLIWCVFELAVIEYKHFDGSSNSDRPSNSFFVLLIVVLALHELAGNFIFGALMSYFAKIADPSIGGTYMTLLNTVANLGAKWPNALALYLLPKITMSSCRSMDGDDGEIIALLDIEGGNCPSNKDGCSIMGGQCITDVDGYTIQSIVCFCAGIVWICVFYRTIQKLELTSNTDWLLVRKNK